MRNTLLTTLAVLLIAGCSSDSGSVNQARYDLLEGVAPAAFPSTEKLQVRVYGLLADEGIVLQTSPVTLQPARNHCWQWDLARQLTVLLSEAMLAEGATLSTPLQVDVSRFNGSLEGTVSIAVSVKFGDKAEAKEYRWQSKQSEPGYEALVIELKRGWKELAGQIARDIKANPSVAATPQA